MFLSVTNVLWSDQPQSTVQCHFQCRHGRCHFPSHFLWCPLQRCSSQSARSSGPSPEECNGQPHRLTTHLCVFIQCACIHCNINIYAHCFDTCTQSEVAIGAETNMAEETVSANAPSMLLWLLNNDSSLLTYVVWADMSNKCAFTSYQKVWDTTLNNKQ